MAPTEAPAGAQRLNPRPALVRGVATLVPAALLVVFLATQYLGAWRTPFINEDWSFLDNARGRSLLAVVVDPALYAGPWLRPWSQGVHYWALQSLFGTRMEYWHAVSALLAVFSLTAYFALARRLAGAAVAGVAVAAVALLAGWGLLLTWIAGAQDLWMLALSLATLQLVASERRGWASITFLFALLSKETAAILPPLVMAWDVLVRLLPPRRALVRGRAMWIVLMAWCAIHPALGGRLWHPAGGASDALRGMTQLDAARSAVLAVVNLDVLPRPESGWARAIGLGFLGAVPLTLLVLWCGRERPASDVAIGPTGSGRTGATDRPPGSRVVVFGSVWALLGWTPLLLPSLHWHSYYSIFGSMGAWLALSVPITRRPWVVALVVIALAGLRAGRSTTMFNDWGEESYVRRAGRTLDVLRRDLVAECPSPRPFTRFYFTDVPAGAGFLIGDGPALRSWYGEPTLTGGFLRDFKARRASEPAGADRFFRYDPARGWVELVAGREDVDAARRSDPSWQRDHDRLARTLTEGGDWGTARAEYAKLAQAVPDSAGYAYMAGLAAMTLGDSLEARRWIAIAVANPAADDEMRAVGASMGIHAPDRARRRPTLR